MKYVYEGKKQIYYEIVNKPFFGSRKKAIEALKNVNHTPYTHNEYIAFIEKCYPNIFLEIELIRFYDYVWQDNRKGELPFHFRLALTYLNPNGMLRDKLFEERTKITSHTGWYPYVMGSRANITTPIHKKLNDAYGVNFNKIGLLSLGRPLELVDISTSDNANAILLKCEGGSILFDTGFGVDIPSNCNLRLVCISHFHRDHISGLNILLKERSVPVIMSEVTLEYMLITDYLSDDEKINLSKNVIVLEKIMHSRVFRRYFDFFPVFHCPGSTGFVYKWNDVMSIYYLGDVCLNNGFMSFGNNLKLTFESDFNKYKYIIMDAAMVGKSAFTIDSEDIPLLLVSDIFEIVRKRNIAFVSSYAETLIYSYILSFISSNRLNDKSIKLVLNDELYYTIKSLWGAVILQKQRAFQDPFIKYVIGNNRENFIESQRLYPLSSLQTINDEENLILFLAISDLENHDQLYQRVKGADVVLVGAWTVKASIPETVSQLKPRSVLRIASPDWSFHSTEQDILDAVREWESMGAKTVLFHNYTKVLKKFIKSSSMAIDYIRKDIIQL